MTLFQSKLGRLRGIKETTFGTDATTAGGISSFFEIPFIEGSDVLELMRPVQTPGHAQQRMDGFPENVLMPKSAAFTFKASLATPTTKATSTVAATHSWLTRILEIAFGSVHQSTGTTFVTGWDAVNGDGTTVTTIRPGSAIGWVNSSGLLECREVKTKSSSTLANKLAFSGSPTNGQTMYGCTTVYTSTRQTGAASSLQLMYEGWNTEHRWSLLGGWLESLTVEWPPGSIPVLTFKFAFANHLRADGSDIVYDSTGDVLGASTYTDVNTLVVVDSEFRVPTVGTSTLSGTLYHPNEITWEFPGLRYEPVKSPAGIQTVLAPVRVHSPPLCRGSFTLPYEDSQEWFTARNSKTAKAVFYQIGSSISVGAVLASCPRVQIVDVQTTDKGGVQNQVVSWVSRTDSDTTAESSYEGLAESAHRLHFF